MIGNASASQSTNQPQPASAGQDDAHNSPPAYDQVSLAPPFTDDKQRASPSAWGNGAGSGQGDGASHNRRKSVKQKWKELKEEDERRKARRYQHVSAAEADRITGLDKHREEEAKKSAERRRGGKSVLGILLLS